MLRISRETINYLNTGHNPTLVSFPDDGIADIYDFLVSDTKKTKNYDPNFAFVPVTVQYLQHPDIANLEQEINNELKQDAYPGDNIIETIVNGYEIVVVIDDVDELADPAAMIAVCDAMIKKYRQRLRFLYVIETPLLFSRIRHNTLPFSSIYDAAIVKKVGEEWQPDLLASKFAASFKQELPVEVIEEISQKSNNHYGVFKRLYRDRVFGTNHIDVYIDNLISSFSIDEINTFKKISSHSSLSEREEKIKQAYESVGFIVDNKIQIPLIAEKMPGYRIRNKILADEQSSELVGLDLELLTRGERRIIEHLMTVNDEVSKEEIAEIIWRDKVDEKYSEWAIDKRMSRLRKKINDLGFNIDIITQYGKGYKLEKIN